LEKREEHGNDQR